MGLDLTVLLVLPILLLVVLLLAGVVLPVRRRLLERRGGTFDCSLRQPPRPDGRGWTLGLARYTGDAVEWYRLFSYAPRPRRRLTRRALTVVGRRAPSGPETATLLGGAVVLQCQVHGRPLELAMNEAALTGLLAWLEAAPPGQDVEVG